MVKLAFRVNRGIEEEHAIFRRVLCPFCESPLSLLNQRAIEANGRIVADIFQVKCMNQTCNRDIEIRFYLPEDYDPLAKYGISMDSK